jgi:hypothetical protein
MVHAPKEVEKKSFLFSYVGYVTQDRRENNTLNVVRKLIEMLFLLTDSVIFGFGHDSIFALGAEYELTTSVSRAVNKINGYSVTSNKIP